MYAPLATVASADNGDPAAAITKPAAIGNKQLVYLIINNTTGATVTLAKAGDASGVGFPAANTETWLAGPILGNQVEEWGFYEAGGTNLAGLDLVFVAGDTKVDTRTTPLSVHDEPTATINVGFTWQQL